jgi:hypothetical protein
MHAGLDIDGAGPQTRWRTNVTNVGQSIRGLVWRTFAPSDLKQFAEIVSPNEK